MTASSTTTMLGAWLKCIAFMLLAVALAGCCVTGNGCYAPTPGIPTAWDGSGAAPTDIAQTNEHKPKRSSRPKTEIIVGPIGDGHAETNVKLQLKEDWAQKEAADRDADANLTKQLKICRNC